MKDKRIYKSSLSREDIESYQSTSNGKVKNAIEQKSLENDFDSDALDGWSENKASLHDLKKIDRKFKVKTTSFLFLFVAVLIIVLLAGINFLMNDSTSKIAVQIAAKNIEKPAVEHTDIHIPSEIASLVLLPEYKQIQPKTVKADFVQKEEIEKNEKREEVFIEELPKQHIPSSNLPKELAKKRFNAKEIYLNDLKLVDYREYRSRPTIPSKQLIITGTSANKETANSTEETDEWKTVDIPYIDYIDKTIAIFGKENFKKALTRLEVILKTYPDDVNANFYAGLCYFNLKNPDKAIQVFEQCLKSEYQNFDEEPEWYIAKSYQQLGNTEKANQLLQSIKAKGGYYAKFI